MILTVDPSSVAGIVIEDSLPKVLFYMHLLNNIRHIRKYIIIM